MSGFEYVVRVATKRDLDRVAYLWIELMEFHVRLSRQFDYNKDFRRGYMKFIAKALANRKGRVFVATKEDEMIGYLFCQIVKNQGPFKEKWIGIIHDAFIKEGHRRKGIASRMTDEALAWFRENDVSVVQVGMAANNAIAKQVWAKLGFEPHLIQSRMTIR